MNQTEQKLLDIIHKNTDTTIALIKKIVADHAADMAVLKAKLKDQDSAELEETEKPEYQPGMKGNLIRILYSCFQIKKPKKQTGKINKNRLAIFLHTTPQNLYNLQGTLGGRSARRIYHAAMLMAQKLSDKDMQDVVRDMHAHGDP
jgi:hypothetical protein